MLSTRVSTKLIFIGQSYWIAHVIAFYSSTSICRISCLWMGIGYNLYIILELWEMVLNYTQNWRTKEPKYKFFRTPTNMEKLCGHMSMLHGRDEKFSFCHSWEFHWLLLVCMKYLYIYYQQQIQWTNHPFCAFHKNLKKHLTKQPTPYPDSEAWGHVGKGGERYLLCYTTQKWWSWN
jgi:hypothetical protein